MAKDFLGQELQVGDKVVCLRPRYRELVDAKISKIMPIMIQVKSASSKYPYITQPCNTVKIQEEKE